MYEEDTIAAVATPSGAGGVAIVRVSGPLTQQIASQIFFRKSGKTGPLKSHTFYHGTVRDPATSKIFDEALLVLMRKPRSYTGEDVIELHCHGGAFLVRRILGLVLAQGARYAEPGEFTRRAFLNGRMDLAQAEAVQELISARTETQAELALQQMHGGLSKHVSGLREELLDILVQVEAAIDFPEEEIELLRREELARAAYALDSKILSISATYERGRLFREGARVCIAGRPNVGKSSLLNALLGHDRVIVTPVPGTTRDVIEESISIDGLPVVLWDTAGIRETDDEVEKLGVDLSLRHLGMADAVVAVLDGSAPLTEEDRSWLKKIHDRKAVTVVNKADLPQQCSTDAIREVAGSRPMLFVSAKRGDGVRDLERCLRELLVGAETEPQIVLTNLRHRNALVRGSAALRLAISSIAENQPPECIAVDLNQTREALEEIVGTIQNEDILDRIFSKFCIGK